MFALTSTTPIDVEPDAMPAPCAVPVIASFGQSPEHVEAAVEAAVRIGQPVGERSDRELDRRVGLIRASRAGNFDVALARCEREIAVDDVARFQLEIGVARNGPLAQRAAELVELDRRVGTVVGQRAFGRELEIDCARPFGRERAGIELARLRRQLPADRGLELDRALRIEAALGLLERELLQRDRFGRAVEIERDVRELARRTDRERAFGVEFLRAARCVDLAVRRQRLADEIGRQLDAFPLQRERRRYRFRIELHFAVRLQRAGGFGCLQRQRLDLQRLAGQRVAERLELHAMVVDVDLAVQRAVLPVAGAFERKRERGQRRIGLHAFRIEARHADLRGPREIARLRQCRRDRRRRRRAEREVEFRLAAVAACFQRAGDFAVGGFPVERRFAVTGIARRGRQRAVQIDAAFGRAQCERLDQRAAARPHAGKIEAVGDEDRQAVLTDLRFLQREAIE